MDAEDITSVSNLMSIYSYFPDVKIPRGTRGGMQINSDNSDSFDISLLFSSILDGSVNNIHDIRTKICAMKKYQLKLVYLKSIHESCR